MTAEVIVAPRTLAECEAVIERGAQGWLEAGAALEEVRERRLFEPEYATFTDYLGGRWEFSRSWAYQCIKAAAMSRTLDTPLKSINAAQPKKRLTAPKVTVTKQDEPPIDAEVTPVPEEEPEDVEGGSAPLEAYEGEGDGEQPGSEDSDLNSVAPGAQPSEPDDTTPPPIASLTLLARDREIAARWVEFGIPLDRSTVAHAREVIARLLHRLEEAEASLLEAIRVPARQDFPARTAPPVDTHGAPPAADLEAVRRTLEAHPNEPLTTTEVARFAHVSPPRTADALRWLAEREYDVSQKGRCWMLRKVTA